MRVVPNQQDLVTLALGVVIVASVVALQPEILRVIFPGM